MKQQEACVLLRQAIQQLEQLPRNSQVNLVLHYSQTSNCPNCGEPLVRTAVFQHNGKTMFCSRCSHQFKERL